MTSESATHTINTSANRSVHALARPETHAWAMERPAVKAAGLTSGMTVVDLGCGDGAMTPFLRGEVGPTGTVIGVDVDSEAIAAARAADTEEGDDAICYIAASAYDTGLPDGSVDVVVARHLFQHLTDPGRALQEITRILAPGGRVVLLDTHDGLLWMHPAPAGHEAFMARASELQRLRGGDREVGRTLAGRLTRHGFVDVHTDIQLTDTAQLPPDLFVDIALAPVAAVYMGDDAAEAQAHLDACRAALADGESHATAGFYATWGTLA